MIETVPRLVAHRGYMQRFPENSWLGLEAALQAGACWLEFDVQRCRDGRFVLLHDDNLLRTGGSDRSVFELDCRDPAVSVHEPARFADRYAPTPLSTLDDVLHRLRDYPQSAVMVEIKQESIDHWGLKTVMRPLVTQLENYPGRCCLISFNDRALHWCRTHSDLPTGWVLQRYDAAHRQAAETLKPHFLICNHRKIETSGSLWAGPWQWMLYDITDPEAALAWAARGADLIETADIGALLAHAPLSAGACRHGL